MTTHEKTKKHASNLAKQQLQTECVKEQHEGELMGLEDVNVFIPEPKVEEEVPKPEPEEVDDPLANLIIKLETAGIDKMCLIYGEQFKRRITNMKCSRIALHKRLALIRDKILQEVSNNDDKSIAQKILDKYFQKKEVAKKDASWIDDFTIGEEVLVTNATYYTQYRQTACGTMTRKGVITKINKTSITIGLFGYTEIDNEFVLKNHTCGRNRIVWSSWTDRNQVVYSRKYVVKKGQSSWRDDEFTEGERYVDYGW
jgi:hypothetical protein